MVKNRVTKQSEVAVLHMVHVSIKHWIRTKLYYCLYYTSDWFKHQILRNNHKTAWMYINPLLFINQLPYNKISSESVFVCYTTETLCEGHVKL